jgi:hypothetical protein
MGQEAYAGGVGGPSLKTDVRVGTAMGRVADDFFCFPHGTIPDVRIISELNAWPR